MARTKSTARDKGTCNMPGCNEPAKWTGLCNACYQFLWYWKGKTPGQVMRRVAALEKAERRMAVLMPERVAKLKRKA